MAICAKFLHQQGRLKNDGFVATVMSNLGLHKYCKEKNLKLLCASVGDRNVLELMQKEHMILGGEQSGHIIFLEHMTTGDGQLAALQLMQILCQTGSTMSQLASEIGRYPQELINVPGPHHNEKKKALMESESVQNAIRQGEALLSGDGRILVRASGTEALIRVMVEAPTAQKAKMVAQEVANAVENAQK